MRVFTTLGARLVLTAVTLVAVVALLIGTVTTLVMRDYLTGQLDQKVEAAARPRRRAVAAGRLPPTARRPATPAAPTSATRGRARSSRSLPRTSASC